MNIDENEIVYNPTLYDYERVCKSPTLYTVLLIITFILVMGISGMCFKYSKEAFGTQRFLVIKKTLYWYIVLLI